ncbi:hypothetical protein GCM10027418_04520 [Mariniluteicoccus endophyticus]
MIEQRDLGGLDWFVVRGEVEDAYAELGEACRDRIRRAVGSAAVMGPVHRRAERSPFLGDVLAATRRSPRHAILRGLARGADVPVAEIELLNLRGDLGTDGLGCTDVALRTPEGVVSAHNEDNEADFDPVALTLRVSGEPARWVFWTPGMVPANTYVVGERGLAYGCDSITVPRPAAAQGRHLAAYALAGAGSLAEVRDLLPRTPSAGGFHYAVTDWTTGAYAGFERVADRCVEMPEAPVQWHTNHLRVLDGDEPSENSLVRGRTASGWVMPSGDPVGWCLDQLARTPMPDGVHRPGATLGTMVLDTRPPTARLTIAAGGRDPVTCEIGDLLV